MGFSPYLRILRLGNCLIAAIAVFIGFSIAQGSVGFSIPLFMAMVSAFLICGAGQTINDYFDRGIDKLIRPEKIIPVGEMSARNALIYSVLLFIAGIIISFFINLEAFAIASAFSVVLIVYSGSMQRLKFLGNFVVAAGTAFTLIYGASVIGNYSAVVFLAASAFFANVGREIIKDVEDISGDKGVKRTLPMIISRNKINTAVMLLYVLAVVFALYVWITGLIKGVFYLVFILISTAIFFNSFRLLLRNKLYDSQQYSKYAMIAALIAFIAGVI